MRRDACLAQDIDDVLRNHRVAGHLDVHSVVLDGVAHVCGLVDSEEERRLVRRVIGRVRGVRAVWDVLQVRGEPEPRVVDIGCGDRKQHDEAVGVDRLPLAGADIVADIERGLPFRDSTVDHAFAVHALEYVKDLVGVMNEIHRVLRPGGVVHVQVTEHRSPAAMADPTHVRHFSRETFKYFCRSADGARLFRPLMATVNGECVYADMMPVKRGEPMTTDDELARYFD